jgi:hypothetical protein
MPRTKKDETESNGVENGTEESGGEGVVPKKASKAKKKVEIKEIVIPRIDIKLLQLTIRGDTDLIVHAWSQKAIQEMLDKQMGKAHKKRENKDPQADYEASLYKLDPVNADGTYTGRYGFPGIAFKLAAVEACRYVDGIPMTYAYGMFHVNDEMVVIESDDGPYMRQDMVRVGGKGPGTGTADIRFRGAFRNWKATITIRYNAAAATPEQIANLFNIAGFAIGAGEWRPPKRGCYGTFHVETL